jgi:hypothetical protein
MRSCLTFFLLSLVAFGQNAFSPAGTWISTLRYFDEPKYDRLQLELQGTKLTGKLGDDVFEGTFQNGRIEGTMKPNAGTTIQLHGTVVADGRIEGTGTVPEQKIDLKWEASRQVAKSTPSSTHTLEPVQFHHFFWDAIEPALYLNPDVAEVVDPQPHVVAKVPKSVLKGLKNASVR